MGKGEGGDHLSPGRQERNELDKAAEAILEGGEFRIRREKYEKLGKTAEAAEIYGRPGTARAERPLRQDSDYKRRRSYTSPDEQGNAAF